MINKGHCGSDTFLVKSDYSHGNVLSSLGNTHYLIQSILTKPFKLLNKLLELKGLLVIKFKT